jgi:hypothetical protein
MRHIKIHSDPLHSSPDQEGKGKVAAKKGSDEIQESVKCGQTKGLTAFILGQTKNYLFFFL